jgi:hypothetical protein
VYFETVFGLLQYAGPKWIGAPAFARAPKGYFFFLVFFFALAFFAFFAMSISVARSD